MKSRNDLRLLGLGLLALVAAIVTPTQSETCTNGGYYGQYCITTIYTYDGVSASTVKVIFYILEAFCIVYGMVLLVRRNKS